ncbi:gamma-glutamyltranspeptidase [Asticcacaulis biprosthecium C19]|uniref:Gamma-glutamyltranspeptidase n=1 Tax=Asticcacaulis biprosthecium C19 TaxID=715226 RepID=F4QJ03_9CAUL|nr:gamma-glutamyltransferase family protein [Asticcacaulis biprosthecium]EGF93066.1 gamma-glutamyltranspeptidase [Asticcacaulis biprosthecium C19]
MPRFVVKTLHVVTLVAVALVAPAYAKPQKVEPIIAAAEPVAVEAGMAALKRGGTAADAAVAVQSVLGLVEPQSSGLGGGAFMLYYDAATGEITDYNGRERAPASATADRFFGSDGKTLPWPDAVTSGRATGVPGAVFMLDQAHKDHGKLKWNSLFDAGIGLADKGFTVSKRLGRYLQTGNFPQKKTPDAFAYFGDGQGGYRKTGDVLTNPAYGDTLRALAAQRSDAFRSGPIAEAIVAKANAAPLPGGMTLEDLAGYRVKSTTIKPYSVTSDFRGKPLCVPYRVYIVCTTNVPSGGIAVLQGLRIAEAYPLGQWGVHDPRAWQVLIEAERLMYADRDYYEGDTPLFAAQQTAYLNGNYALSRAATITVGKANAAPKAGKLPVLSVQPGADATLEPAGTTHFVIRDSYGNVLSMTTTVESVFGSGRMVGGFFLNNQLTDFSFNPTAADGTPAANAVAGGKHPRSSMAPVIVFDAKGKVVAAVGSPGGNSILSYNLKTLIGVLDWKLTMQDAINLPNVVARGESIRIEKERMEPKVWDGLVAMGYQITAVSGEESGLNGILRKKDGRFDGGSDPRRSGIVMKGGQPSRSEPGRRSALGQRK